MAEQAELPVTTTQPTETAPAVETKPAAETSTETKPAESPAPETKPAADTKPEGEKPAAEADAIDYAKALAAAVPEGMKIDDAAAKPFIDAFAKHGLTADAVKELTALQAAANKAATDGQAKAFKDQVDTWKGEATKTLTPQELGNAKQAAGKMFDAKTVELMEHFGMMDHPGVLKGLSRAFAAIKDDSFVPGDAGSVNGARDARSQFPNSNMNP